MAFTNEGLKSASGSKNEIYERTYTRVYRLKSDNRTTDDERAAVNAVGISPNTPHPTDLGAVAKSISAQTVSAFNDGTTKGMLWDVTVEYGPWNPLEHSTDGDPLNQPLRYRLDPITVEKPIFLDNDGNPVINAAGDPFDPPLIEEDTEYLLTVLRNEVSVNVALICANSGKGQINDSIWNGYPAKTVKILPIKLPERLWSQVSNTLYFPMEYVFHINFDTWTRKVLNAGYGEVRTVAGTSKRISILDGSGVPTTVPVLLDVAGHSLPLPIDPMHIVILEFETKPIIDFGIFNLDTVFA